ncbi:5356_t:CDS:1, partial [Gigaspora margarita]
MSIAWCAYDALNACHPGQHETFKSWIEQSRMISGCQDNLIEMGEIMAYLRFKGSSYRIIHYNPPSHGDHSGPLTMTHGREPYQYEIRNDDLHWYRAPNLPVGDHPIGIHSDNCKKCREQFEEEQNM